MSYKLKSLKHSTGFTIIEVIIVLVIAAVIMLAVFLVVPQLQTSQRNSRRQADARAVLAAAQQYAANNNGAAATTSGQITTITGVKNDPSSNSAYTYTVQASNAPAAPTALGNMTLATSNAKCGTNNTLASGSGAAVVVAIEPAGSTFCVSDNR